VLEREVLELPPQLRHAEAVRQRRVEVARLLRDAPALLRRQPVERSHVVQTIGELDDDDACVLRDRQQQLAIVLHLPLLLRRAGGQLGDFRQPVDDAGDLSPELGFDVGHRHIGILDDVVDQAARHGEGIELEVGEHLRHLDAVGDERIARVSRLTAVRLLAEPVGAREQLAVEPLVVRRLRQVPTGDDVRALRRRR
jgi:hypothetical protein